MKRVLARLLALLLLAVTPLTAAAEPEPMSYLDYTDDITPEGNPVYYFPELSLTLPAEWKGKVFAMRTDSGTSFYHRASYDKYQGDGYNGGGLLFSLGASVNHSFSELPSFRYLGFSEESVLNYYLVLPTDYQAYNTEAIRAEYDALFAQIDYVVDHAVFYADAADADLAVISCPELGFTTMADPAYSWEYEEGTGIYIYTESDGSIPYVIVWQDEDLIGEPLEYIKEQFTPHIEEQYGDDLIATVEYESYDIGGKELPAGLYTYRVQEYLVNMLRLYDSTGDRTVAYTAKYLEGEGDATLAALDTAIRNFQAE